MNRIDRTEEVNMSATTETKALSFDPDQLRAKYEQERVKRLREDANDQYRDCLLYTSPSPRDRG